MTLTHERLKALLSYSPETGVFRWKAKSSPASRVVIGAEAGSRNKAGYIYIEVDGGQYRANRLAWFYVHGVWPTHTIDHEDGNPLNNRIKNLRDVPHKKNCRNKRNLYRNNTSGYMGVVRQGDGWRAQIIVDGKMEYLGCFQDPAKASEAYQARQAEVRA